MNQQKFFRIIGVTIGLVTLIIYGKLLPKTDLLVRDDRWLTGPLKSVHRFSDWWAAIRSAEIPDFQPVRDLSYWIDWRVADIFGISPLFHISNTIIWLVCLALIWKIARLSIDVIEPKEQWISGLVVLIVAIHPVCVEAVAWISGRKHLLSLAFTLAATLTVVQFTSETKYAGNRTKVWLAPFFYAFAVFSQPINLLWPIWATGWITLTNPSIDKHVKLRPWFAPMVACAGIGLVAALINTSVYQGTTLFGFLLTPHALIYGKKLGGFRFDELGISILATGRYFMNLLAPLKIAHRYNPGSLLNLIGVFCLPIAVWLIWKVKKVPRYCLAWLLYAVLPIVVVTAQLSDIFVADSYALSAVPGFAIAFGLILTQINLVTTKTKYVAIWFIGISLLVLTTAYSASIADSWTSAKKLWSRAQLVEETPDSLYFTSAEFLSDGNFDAALNGALRLIDMAPGRGKPLDLLAYAVCDHPGLSREQKLETLARGGDMNIPPIKDCLAELHADAGEHADATALMLEIADQYPAYFHHEMKGALQRLEVSCRQVPEYKVACDQVLRGPN